MCGAARAASSANVPSNRGSATAMNFYTDDQPGLKMSPVGDFPSKFCADAICHNKEKRQTGCAITPCSGVPDRQAGCKRPGSSLVVAGVRPSPGLQSFALKLHSAELAGRCGHHEHRIRHICRWASHSWKGNFQDQWLRYMRGCDDSSHYASLLLPNFLSKTTHTTKSALK